MLIKSVPGDRYKAIYLTEIKSFPNKITYTSLGISTISSNANKVKLKLISIHFLVIDTDSLVQLAVEILAYKIKEKLFPINKTDSISIIATEYMPTCVCKK